MLILSQAGTTMNKKSMLDAVLAASVMSAGLSGCAQYVKETGFNATISQLQEKDAQSPGSAGRYARQER